MTHREDSLSLNLPPEFKHVRMRLWVCYVSFHGLSKDIVSWANESPAHEAAAFKVIDCWNHRRNPDRAVREKTYVLDLKGMGLTRMLESLRYQWLQRIDLRNNLLTKAPEGLLGLVNMKEATEGVRCRIDLRGNPLELTVQEWDRLTDTSRTTGPVFILDPKVEPEESRQRPKLSRLPSEICEELGVGPYATAREIKLARNKLALRFHPDKNLGNPEAVARFQRIDDAYVGAKAYRKELD